MRLAYVFRSATLLVLTGASVAQAKDSGEGQTLLEPASQWHLDYADEKCVLARTFGTSDDLHYLSFSQGSPSAGFGFVAAGPSFKKFRDTRKTTIGLAPTEDDLEIFPFKGENSVYGHSLILSAFSFGPSEVLAAEALERDLPAEQRDSGELVTLPKVDVEGANRIDSITLTQRNRIVKFQTGSMGPAMAALNSCSEDLLRHWGLDVEKHQALSRKVSWENTLEVVKKIQARYPSKALRAGQSAIFRMRLLINSKGEVTECKLDNVTVADSLDSPACAQMKFARFKPALDADGKPLNSYYVTNVTYRLN